MDNCSTMLEAARHGLAIVAEIATVASIAYCSLCVWTGMVFARHRSSPTAVPELQPVSILKPLKGTDPEMYEALRSQCLQDYPEYEILFGVSEEDDPAAEVVKKLVTEFPNRRLRLIICDKRLGANGKVSVLAQLVPQAAHEFLLVNDSDIRVDFDYLRTVISELSQPGVGLVTCLYRGIAGRTISSKLEALGISTDFIPGVLAAQKVEGGLQFGLGSTLAFRRRDLNAIGGFESIAGYLADDYELGHRIAKQGSRIELSRSVVDSHLPPYNFADFFAHQLRWMRTIWASRPAGYLGFSLTFTLPWALAAVLLSTRPGTLWMLVAAALARYAMAFVGSALVLREKGMLRSFWLLPIRDFVAVVIWLVGLFGRKITWRGESFRLVKGKLEPY